MWTFISKLFKRYTVKDIPKLANIKKTKDFPEGEPYDVYIGRSNVHLGLKESIWGNPYLMKRESDRHNVVKKHMVYLKKNTLLLSKLKELSGKTLGCYCYSSATGNGKLCHGHNIIEMYKREVLKIYTTKK